MKILLVILTFLTSICFSDTDKAEIHDFKLPNLAAKSESTNKANDENENAQLSEDESLKIKTSLKKELLEIDRRIRMTEQMKKLQVKRAYHFQQKAEVYYNAAQFDEYKSYMQLVFETEERIVHIQGNLEKLQIKRYNLLVRLQEDQKDKSDEKSVIKEESSTKKKSSD